MLFIALSYADQNLKVVVAESTTNYVAQEYKLPEILGFFAQQFGFDIYSPIAAKMTNVIFYKQ